MKYNQKMYLAVTIIILALTLTGCKALFQGSQAPSANDAATQKGGDTMMDKKAGDDVIPADEMMKKDETEVTSDETMEKKDDAMMEDDKVMTVKFSGQVLAGSESPVVAFNKADYEAAISSGRAVLLYFYANWCPVCRAEVSRMYDAFDGFTHDDAVALVVNFNDNETDEAEVALAREYGVAYQHTKVIIKNGQRILKSPESWDTARYVSEIAAAIQK